MQSYMPTAKLTVLEELHKDNPNKIASLATQREFFTGQTDDEVKQKMEQRAREVEERGLVVVGRTKIGRNTSCPCGSGLKFKKCCLALAR